MSEPRSGWRKRARRADRSGLDPALEAAVNAAYERGTPISEADARRAAEAGSRPGMTVYGIGLGNRGAFTEAQKWLVRAIELGDAMAAVALGTMHMDLGQFDRADQCFRLAATSGHPAARRGLQELAARRAKRGSLPPVSEPAGPGPRRWRLQPTRPATAGDDRYGGGEGPAAPHRRANGRPGRGRLAVVTSAACASQVPR